MNNVASDLPGFYYDLQSLAPLKQAATEDPRDIKNLRAVAEQFESMFMQMVLKSMRAATPGDNLFDSKQSLFYRDMFDQQLSVKMSQDGGLGLADLLVEQLSRNSIHERPDPFADNKRGGFQGMPIQPFSPPRNQLAPVNPVSNTSAPAPAVPQPVTKHANTESTAATTNNVSIQQSSTISMSKGSWDSPAEFVRDIWPHAVGAAKQLGVDPKVLVAQSALETGWGSKLPKHADGRSSFNLFGIKAGSDWQGERVRVGTLEYEGDRFVSEKAAFRAYSSVADAMNDYVDFLQSRARYAGALENAADPEKYSRALQKAGYATDPVYADKILRVMDSEPIANGLASLKTDSADA